MPFREKAKNLFRSKTRGDSLSTINTIESNHDVYQPGETMPPPKYRRPPQKEHKDKLEAFSFADAWRKRSFQSTHSPGGTRVSSRRASFLSTGRKSRKSVTRPSEDGGERKNLEPDAQLGATRSQDSGVVPELKLPNGTDHEGEDGIAKVQSKDSQSVTWQDGTAEAKPQTNGVPNGVPNGLHKTVTAKDHVPFSEQDIASAMQRSQVEVSAQS